MLKECEEPYKNMDLKVYNAKWKYMRIIRDGVEEDVDPTNPNTTQVGRRRRRSDLISTLTSHTRNPKTQERKKKKKKNASKKQSQSI